MSVKQIVENNVVVFLLTVAVVSFTGGVSAYEAILRISGRTHVSADELKHFENLKNELSKARVESSDLKKKLEASNAAAAPSGEAAAELVKVRAEANELRTERGQLQGELKSMGDTIAGLRKQLTAGVGSTRIGVSLDAIATPNKGGCGKEGPVLIEETYKFSNGVDPRQLLMVSVGGPWPLGVVRPNDGFTTTVASPPTWETVFCTQANQTLRYQRVFINVSTGAMSKVMDVQVKT